MQFIDTNIFIRVLAKDDPVKSEKCFNLLKKVEDGKIELHTTESVITEIVYILESKRLYNLQKRIISNKLLPILKMKGLKVAHKNIIIYALSLFSKNKLDFEDTILISYTLHSKSKDIYSYDKGIGKIKGIRRLEP